MKIETIYGMRIRFSTAVQPRPGNWRLAPELKREPALALTTPPRGGRLVCPKCEGLMEQIIFRGILVERCEACRGVFLDDGEIDELVEKSASRSV